MTTKHVPASETTFSLAYETEAIIPVIISMSTLRVEGVIQDQNNTLFHLMLDHSEERQQAQIRIAAYQHQIWATHHKVKYREFQVGDLVLKHMIQSTQQRNQGKLGPNLEGTTSSSLREARGHTPWPIRMGTNSISNGILFT